MLDVRIVPAPQPQPERQPVSEPTDRCKHGVRFPHECRECEAEPSIEKIQRWRESGGLTEREPQPEPIDPHMIVAEDRFPDDVLALFQPQSQRKCGCRACLTPAELLCTFVVCPQCGNKRCPKADDHRNACTDSNALGQVPQPERQPVSEPTETQDVPVLEQLRRMAEDAERYRWLRGSSCRDHSLRWTQWEIRHWRAPFWSSDLRYGDLDAAIDAARREK